MQLKELSEKLNNIPEDIKTLKISGVCLWAAEPVIDVYTTDNAIEVFNNHRDKVEKIIDEDALCDTFSLNLRINGLVIELSEKREKTSKMCKKIIDF